MTKKVTSREADDATTDRGTVKGHHARPGDDVTEGGVAASPVEHHGAPKGSATKAQDEGAVAGDNTSPATAGKAEKLHAAEVATMKPQSDRNHRKHRE